MAETFGGPRFGRSQIRLNAYVACTRKRIHGFICSDVVLMTYVTPGPRFLKTLIAHAVVFKTCECQSYWNTWCITNNPGPLPLRSHIRQTSAESGPGLIWDRPNLGPRHRFAGATPSQSDQTRVVRIGNSSSARLELFRRAHVNGQWWT